MNREIRTRLDADTPNAATKSLCEYYAGNHPEALRLAVDGRGYAGTGPQGVRLAVNAAARVMGKLGDTDGVHRAVGDAYDLMSSNDAPGGLPSSISFGCYSPAQTASNAATAYLSLGLVEQARRYLELARPDIDRSGSPWSRSLVMIDLAGTLITARDADLEHAATLVRDALDLSAARPIIAVQQRATEFLRAATNRWGNTRHTNELREALPAAGTR